MIFFLKNNPSKNYPPEARAAAIPAALGVFTKCIPARCQAQALTPPLLLGENTKQGGKIAVEIKSFLGTSPMDDFEDALGKFRLYLSVLEDIEPDRTLYLAVPKHFFNKFFEQAIFLKIAKKNDLKMIVYDFTNSTIEKWIN